MANLKILYEDLDNIAVMTASYRGIAINNTEPAGVADTIIKLKKPVITTNLDSDALSDEDKFGGPVETIYIMIINETEIVRRISIMLSFVEGRIDSKHVLCHYPYTKLSNKLHKVINKYLGRELTRNEITTLLTTLMDMSSNLPINTDWSNKHFKI